MRDLFSLPTPWFELACVGIALGCGLAFGLALLAVGLWLL